MKLSNCFLFLLCLTGFFLSGLAQETAHIITEEDAEESEMHQWMVALSAGYTYIPKGFEETLDEKGTFVPSIGLDVHRRIKENWGIGFMADLELANYLVDFNREQLERERALLLVISAFYEVLPAWSVFAGGGIELEKHRNFAIARLGTSYEFEIARSWVLGPNLFFDFKEGVDTWTIGLVFGREF